MPEPSGAPPAQKGSSFASLLTGLATRDASGRGHDGLKDDIATISYEQALRTHARTRPAAALGLPFEPSAMPLDEPVAPVATLPPAQPSRRSQAAVHISEWPGEEGDSAVGSNPALAATRKSASITIRLTKAECEQVHARAAAAGLTASAYLRSCLFETEALRAQVKEALEQFRGTASAGPAVGAKKPVQSVEPVAGRRSWLRSRWLGGEGAKTA